MTTIKSVPEQSGLVISHHGAKLDVEDAEGKMWCCTARHKAGVLVCGDQVSWQAVTEHEGVIVQRNERKNLLARPNNQGQLKPVAANIDQVVVVTAPHPVAAKEGINIVDDSLIDPYVAAAELSNMGALIIINKIDLLSDEALRTVEKLAADYRTIGYGVIFTSVKQGLGMDLLSQCLKDKTSVVVGKSGVGKSSLIKTLLPEMDIRVAAEGNQIHGGKHTTSVTTLYHLTEGGRLIDSPGVREFGLWRVTVQDIARSYAEFRPYLGACRFNDCTHLVEPGCAVQQAFQAGKITLRRMESYKRLAGNAALESSTGRT